MDRESQLRLASDASRIADAYERIKNYVIQTPLLHIEIPDLWLKCENLQTTGSFKLRGALAKLSLLPKGSQIVTASTGNHGLGVAKAATIYDHQLNVFLPKSASASKKAKLNAMGVQIHEVEGDSLDAEMKGQEFANENHQIWVSPYNDADVISGQGTIALEVLQQIDHVDKMYVTVGGGGLISGIATWMKAYSPQTQIIGCLPGNSPEMYVSQIAGRVVTVQDQEPTLSDGSAGPLEPDSITFDLCRNLVKNYSLVTEEEIKEAICRCYLRHQLVIEGAAGVALASALRDRENNMGLNVVVLLCGGNIDPVVHQQLCNP